MAGPPAPFSGIFGYLHRLLTREAQPDAGSRGSYGRVPAMHRPLTRRRMQQMTVGVGFLERR